MSKTVRFDITYFQWPKMVSLWDVRFCDRPFCGDSLLLGSFSVFIICVAHTVREHSIILCGVEHQYGHARMRCFCDTCQFAF